MKLSATSIAIAKMLLPYDDYNEVLLAAQVGALNGPWDVHANYMCVEFFTPKWQLYITRAMSVSATTEDGACTRVFQGVEALLSHYGELP